MYVGGTGGCMFVRWGCTRGERTVRRNGCGLIVWKVTVLPFSVYRKISPARYSAA